MANVSSATIRGRTPAAQLARAIALARELASSGSPDDREMWSEVELTMPQLKLLAVLAARGPTPAGALATALGVRPPTITGILGRLARRGFVEQRRSNEDGRVRLVALSAAGGKLVERLFAAQERILKRTLRRLAPGELAIVVRAFELLVRVSGSARPNRSG